MRRMDRVQSFCSLHGWMDLRRRGRGLLGLRFPSFVCRNSSLFLCVFCNVHFANVSCVDQVYPVIADWIDTVLQKPLGMQIEALEINSPNYSLPML